MCEYNFKRTVVNTIPFVLYAASLHENPHNAAFPWNFYIGLCMSLRRYRQPVNTRTTNEAYYNRIMAERFFCLLEIESCSVLQSIVPLSANSLDAMECFICLYRFVCA